MRKNCVIITWFWFDCVFKKQFKNLPKIRSKCLKSCFKSSKFFRIVQKLFKLIQNWNLPMNLWTSISKITSTTQQNLATSHPTRFTVYLPNQFPSPLAPAPFTFTSNKNFYQSCKFESENHLKLLTFPFLLINFSHAFQLKLEKYWLLNLSCISTLRLGRHTVQ
jgi:hypothetical protein